MIAFAVLVFLMAGATIGYAAVPQSTIRTTGAGITTYVGHNFNATGGYFVGANQIIDSTRAAVFVTLNTGQGANELYDMDQNVLQASAVTFATVDTGQGAYDLFAMNQDVESTDAVIFATVDTGQGANELWDMDQNVETTSDVTHNSIDAEEYYLSSVNKTDIMKYPQQDYSYLVWRDGSTYFAKNGINGSIDFTGADADVLINSALGASTGIVHLKPATYPTDSTINVGAGDTLEGEGSESIINYDAGGSCVTMTGDDSKVRSLKIVIVAGAGGAGTRPNGIMASGRNNVRISDYFFYGDITVGYDNNQERQMGVVFISTTNSSISKGYLINSGASSISFTTGSNQNTISDIQGGGNLDYGIGFVSSHNNTVNNIILWDNGVIGFLLDVGSSYNTITNLIANGNGNDGYGCSAASVYNRLTGFHLFNNGRNGARFDSSSNFNSIMNGVISNSGDSGLFIDTTTHIKATNIDIIDAGKHGVQLSTANYNILNSIYSFSSAERGFSISTSNNNTIVNNKAEESQSDGMIINNANNNMIFHNQMVNNGLGAGTWSGIYVLNSDDNVIRDNLFNYNDYYGINIDSSTSERNFVKDNQLIGNAVGRFRDIGTDTKLSVVSFQFTEPIVGTTLTSSPTGIEIDANTEGALAWGQLPFDLQEVVRIKIWAVSVVADAHNMTLQITANGGGDNEPYNTENIAIATLNSTSFNFAGNDVILWTITATNDADVDDLEGGDSIEVIVNHEAASGGSVQTDAIFRVVEFEYV